MRRFNVFTLLLIFSVMFVYGCSNIEDILKSTDNSSDSKPVVEKVMVWFDAQDSSIVNWSQEIPKGTAIAEPEKPVLEGSTFLGWYSSSVGGYKWNFSNPINQDITLYARWQKDSSTGGTEEPEKPVTYTVTYDNGGKGSYIEPLTVTSGTYLYENHLPTLSYTGYTFLGWYYNDTKIISNQLKVTSNITLVAKWMEEAPGDITPPGEVTDLQVKLEGKSAILTWINPTDEDYVKFEVSYKKPSGGSSNTFGESSGAGKAERFEVIKYVTNINGYTFTVRTIDYNGNKSEGVSVSGSGEVIKPDPEPEPEPEPEPTPEPEPNPDFSEYKNKTAWFYGIEGPLPTDSVWRKPGGENGVQVWELDWKAEYGWYDVNKTHLVDKYRNNNIIAKDNNMCWAATSSNILHWWFRINEKYIKKYDELNPDKKAGRPDAGYPKRDMPYASQYQESAIFQYYIDHFEDEAGYGDGGVNWFVSGEWPTLPQPTNKEGGGFFSDVFPKGKYIANKVTGLSREMFTSTIIDAIEGHKIVGLAEKSGMNHIMTVWGAEFDENGYVSAIYLADNNVNQDSEPYTKDLTRRLIRYSTYTGTTATYTEMSLFWNNYFSPITALVVVDSGQQQWEDFFKSKGIKVE